FFQAEDGIRDLIVTGVQTCALPISIAQDMGYIIIGQKVDPDDWSQLGPGVPLPAAKIVENVLHEAPKGNIILLHDGGGDRSQTRSEERRVGKGWRIR